MKAVLSLLCCLGLAVFLPAEAHQKNAALTTVVIKPDHQGIEVMHRFYIHDVEKAVNKMLGKAVDFRMDAEAQMAFGQHVKKAFSMRYRGEAQPIDLDYIGHEVEGKFFWVYQEALFNVKVTELEVRQHSLMQIFPLQQNLVNLEGSGRVKSLSFVKGSDWQSFSF